MSLETKSKVLYHNLDTSFVNFWALLRKLTRDGFIGRVHVELKDYSADVFMNGSNSPLVREVDRTSGTETLEEAALHRVVLRTRESPGSISIFEGADEAAVTVPGAVTAPGEVATGSDRSAVAGHQDATVTEPGALAMASEVEAEFDRVAMAGEGDATVTEPEMDTAPEAVASGATQEAGFHPVTSTPGTVTPVEATEWQAMVKASGDLISAVERAVNNSGSDFDPIFRSARVELADDYPFLDPTSSVFQYANSEVKLRDELPADTFVTGLSEVLRRVVNKVAGGDRARRLRERVALELALAARKRDQTLKRSGFDDQLDRIAGTKVI